MTNNRSEKSHQMNSCVCRFLENEEKNNGKILKTGQSYLVKYKKNRKSEPPCLRPLGSSGQRENIIKTSQP